MIELDINNRVGSTLSADLRPAILNSCAKSRQRGRSSTPVNVTGTNFVGHGPLFCQFGNVAVSGSSAGKQHIFDMCHS